MLLPAVTNLLETGPVFLFVDGHISHVSLELIQLAKQKGVTLFCLPSHTTHVLQLLDVAVYWPVKKSWKKILKEYKMETCAAKVDKTVFQVLYEGYGKNLSSQINLRQALDELVCAKSQRMPSQSLPMHHHYRRHQQLHPLYRPKTVILVTIQCTCKCHAVSVFTKHITPVRVYLRGYFANLIGEKQAEKKTGRRKVISVCTGEALTSDEMITRLEDEDRERKRRLLPQTKSKRRLLLQRRSERRRLLLQRRSKRRRLLLQRRRLLRPRTER